ncbi:UNVERIFIED_CONTAM: hypothetical protein Sradi_0709600 [Sesamum radiatum]|uniref:SWIM-type domain-containing protein n=1 Tax=Sesamum radiatum TaxID=300843 RepID=A0AAW2VNZ1_SESRA
MSDKQKGLIQAFISVFPNSAHRFCVRHLHNNFKTAGFRGLAYKNALWKAARASTPDEFKLRMEELRQLDQTAFDWFNDKPASEWSKSHFTEIPKCDMLLNNCCESFNANIMDARDKPILTMLEWIREYLMRRLQENRDKAARKWTDGLCPKIQKILQKQVEKIGDCIPIKANDRHYQISCYDGAQFSVDLDRRTCTCRHWQLSGIPCKHACSAIVNQNLKPEDMVHAYYNVEIYKAVYEPAILPISGELLWTETCFIPPLPPNFEGDLGDLLVQGEGSLMSNKRRQKKVKGKGKKRASSSSNPRPRNIAHMWTQVDHSTRRGQQTEAITQDMSQTVLTDSGPTMTQLSQQGPSMYEQLQMAHNTMSFQPQTTLQPRLNIRAPPPMTGHAFMPCFSNRPAIPVSKTVIKEHGQKFVDLSKWPTSTD